ncbi:hypothetical protein Clacol_004406 [Clathrus columnatus]|uniref:Uncharacterized protein n=1 Tax=Clathrus columnatus TaxID=1419009 RepID=A0AAV5AE21_9AGAM|nr:hypothetical protein Clacol_004406 [Clathrus columnatus]
MSTGFNDTLGAILLGGIGRKDSRPFDASIAVIWILDTIHQALVAHVLYFYMVLNYNNSAAVDNLVWSIIAEILPAAGSNTLVRGTDSIVKTLIKFTLNTGLIMGLNARDYVRNQAKSTIINTGAANTTGLPSFTLDTIDDNRGSADAGMSLTDLDSPDSERLRQLESKPG